MQYPANVTDNPITQLKIRYIKPITILPSFIKLKTSKLKVLNVVNPPKNPTVRKILSACGKSSDLFAVKPNK